MNSYDVIIVGGGYSGCVCAILLARQSLNVAIVEKNDILCRKILSTGNGRCNFTNENMSKENFFSESSLDSFCFKTSNSIEFLKSLGIIEKNVSGYYYPITNQAKTVRDAIENEANLLKIKTYYNASSIKIQRDQDFSISLENEILHSKNLVIATGGKSAKALGSSGDGYYYASKFGIKVTKLAPSLVGTKSSDKSLKLIAGVRALGLVSYKDKKCYGEIQFNKDGISGYPVMCLSRFIGFDENIPNKKLSVDFLPDLDIFTLENNLINRLKKYPNPYKALNGLLNDKCVDLILKKMNLTEASRLDSASIHKLAILLKSMEFSIDGTKGFDNSQVTAGGISLKELDNHLMVKRKDLEGLYFIGEVCDVDGICGGYNLQWALESAILSSNQILEKIKG